MTIDDLFEKLPSTPLLFVGYGKNPIIDGNSIEFEMLFISLNVPLKNLIKCDFPIKKALYFLFYKKEEYTVYGSHKYMAAYQPFTLFYDKKPVQAFNAHEDLYQSFGIHLRDSNTTFNVKDDFHQEILTNLDKIHSGLKSQDYAVVRNKDSKTVWLLPSTEIFSTYYGLKDSDLMEVALRGTPFPLHNEEETKNRIATGEVGANFIQLRKEIKDRHAFFAYMIKDDSIKYGNLFRNIYGKFIEDKQIRARIPFDDSTIYVRYIDIVGKKPKNHEDLQNQQFNSIRFITNIMVCYDEYPFPEEATFDRDNNGNKKEIDETTKPRPIKPVVHVPTNPGSLQTPVSSTPKDPKMGVIDLKGTPLFFYYEGIDFKKVQKIIQKTTSNPNFNVFVKPTISTLNGNNGSGTKAGEGRYGTDVKPKTINEIEIFIDKAFKALDGFRTKMTIYNLKNTENNEWAWNRCFFLLELYYNEQFVYILEIEEKKGDDFIFAMVYQNGLDSLTTFQLNIIEKSIIKNKGTSSSFSEFAPKSNKNTNIIMIPMKHYKDYQSRILKKVKELFLIPSLG